MNRRMGLIGLQNGETLLTKEVVSGHFTIRNINSKSVRRKRVLRPPHSIKQHLLTRRVGGHEKGRW